MKAGERTFFADNLRYKKPICHEDEDLQPGKICTGEGYSKNGADPIIVGNVGIGLTFENCHRNGRVYEGIMKMTGDAVSARCLFRYYGQDVQMLQGRPFANHTQRNVSGWVGPILR